MVAQGQRKGEIIAFQKQFFIEEQDFLTGWLYDVRERVKEDSKSFGVRH